MTHKPLLPPKEYQKHYGNWWLSATDGDGRRETPTVWEWSVGRQQWFRSGTMFINSIGHSPEDMCNFVIVGMARVPDTWSSCEDIADRG